VHTWRVVGHVVAGHGQRPATTRPTTNFLVCKSDYRIALLHGDHKLIVHSHTHLLYPPNLPSVDERNGGCSRSKTPVWSCRITVLRKRYQHLGLTQVPYIRRLLSKERTPRSPYAYVNQRLQIQLELLMMSGMPLETCWAFIEQWINKFYYKVASCWLFLLRMYKENNMWIHKCSRYS
jgi:hypothetical protein